MRHFKFTDMRRHKLNWIWIILLGLFVGSCEDYLDRSPDDGLSEDDVYKDYSSLLGFMDRIFQNGDKIGRASCREECLRLCRSRWSPYH